MEYAWLAGLLEGEASFIGRFDKAGYISCRIQLNMTDKDIVYRAGKICNAPSICTQDPTRWDSKLGSKMQYYFHIAQQDDLVNLCSKIYPYMGIRRKEQINNMMALIWKHGRQFGGMYVRRGER